VRTTTFIVAALPIAALFAACSRAPRTGAANDAGLQRDLKLAATSTLNLATPPVNPANFNDLETAPPENLRRATHLVKATGPKAVASRAPTLRATQIPQVAATEQVPQVQTVAAAPAPNLDPVATVPRPGSAPQLPAAGAGTAGNGAAGTGGFGPSIGVILGGGGLDGDHCEPHGGHTPGVFLPQPGGVGGTRFPVIRPRGGTIYH
jgi:hypothetical protein